MEKKILQITIQKPPKFKTKLGIWFYVKIWFKVWYIWRPKVMAVIYKGLADFIYWLVPQNIKDQIDKEMEEFKFDIRIRTEDDETE